jgi:hypothetical protein
MFVCEAVTFTSLTQLPLSLPYCNALAPFALFAKKAKSLSLMGSFLGYLVT